MSTTFVRTRARAPLTYSKTYSVKGHVGAITHAVAPHMLLSMLPGYIRKNLGVEGEREVIGT